ncbi:MAG: hypothetical protein ACT4UQ_02735 [Gammaproteobacteria bacterium]
MTAIGVGGGLSDFAIATTGGGFRLRARTATLGISTDSLESHRRFKDHWKQTNLYGRKMMGIERSTFLIDAEGVLRRAWRKVRVAGHAEEVLAAARGL